MTWPSDKPEAEKAAAAKLPRRGRGRGWGGLRGRGTVADVAGLGFAEDAAMPPPTISTEQALADVSAPQPAHFDFAASLIDRLPPTLRSGNSRPARGGLYRLCMLLHADPAEDEPELQHL